MSRSPVDVLVAVVIGFVVAGTFAFFGGLAHEPFAPVTTMLMGAGAAGLTLVMRQSLSRNRKVARGSKADAKAALESAPPEGRAALFIYRDQFMARAVGSVVVIDGTDIGQLRGSTFYRVDLAPGEHRVLSTMTNVKDAAASVTLAAGDRAYLRVALKMTMTATRQQLETIPAAEAAATLAGCSLLLPQARLPEK